MMSNDDSFSNIAPAVETKPESVISEEKKQVKESDIDDLNLDQSIDKEITAKKPATTGGLDIDSIINDIIAKEGFKEGKMMYDSKVIHPKNPEYLDEYVDEDDPGFDTYVVNEENFVASC